MARAIQPFHSFGDGDVLFAVTTGEVENPLLERVKFAAIFSSNLDEFFMIRVAGVKRKITAGITLLALVVAASILGAGGFDAYPGVEVESDPATLVLCALVAGAGLVPLDA